MQRYPHKIILVLLSLLLVGQSLLPAAALAEVSMRCRGASLSSKPCAQAALVAADAATITKHFAGLACCKDMVDCPAMIASGQGYGPQNTLPSYAIVASTSKCLVSVSLLDTKPATLGPQAHQWLLNSAPALAPPVVRPAVPLSLAAAIRFSPVSFDLLPRAGVRSHGLRGPPRF